MNTLTDLGAPKRSRVNTVKAALLLVSLLLANSASANLIVRDGSTATVTGASVLDVNCGDVTLDSGSVLNVTSSTLDNVLNFNQAPGSTFNDSGATINTCRPQLAMQFSPDTVEINEVSTLTITIDNPTNSAATSLSLSTALAPLNDLIVASPANESTSCAGGSVTAPSGSSSISLAGGQVGATSSCELSVDVMSSVSGVFPNSSGDLSSSAGTSSAASATLTVLAAPIGGTPEFSVVFLPDLIGPGSTSTLRFSLSNSTLAPITGIQFVNALPAGLSIATSSATTDCPAASLSAPRGGTSISFSNGVLLTGSCTIEVPVVSNAAPLPGSPVTLTNTSGSLTSSGGTTAGVSDDLVVQTESPGFFKSFSPSSVTRGGVSRLTLTVDNSANTSGVSTLNFVDTLPEGMLIASPARVVNDCGSTAIPADVTAIAGTNRISLFANGFLPTFPALDADGSCSLSVDVVANRSGELINVTDDLMAGFVSFGKASATLDVIVSPLEIIKSFVNNPAPPGTSTNVVYTLTNFNREFAANSLAFEDDLGAALTGLTFSSLVSSDCGGSIMGVGTTLLTLNNGSLPPLGSCRIEISASVPAATIPGQYPSPTNTVNAIVDGGLVNGNSANDILYAEPAPELIKEFIDNPVSAGATVEVEYTINNTSTTSMATDIAFDDIYETILATAATVPAAESCGVGSSVVFTPLSNPPVPCNPCDADPAKLSLTGGELAPGASCTFSVVLDVSQDASNGEYMDASQVITATVDGATLFGEPAVDTLVISAGPDLNVVFTPDTIAPGGTTTLEFTLEHAQSAATDASDITFTNDLSAVLAGLTVSLPPSPNPPCGPGSSLTASAGNTLLTFADGALAAGESCTFSVAVDVPASATYGTVTNTTSVVTATVDGEEVSSPDASNDLVVSGLTISSEFIGNPALPGEVVTLRFEIENTDPANDVTNITFTDDLLSVLPGSPDLTVFGSLPSEPCGTGSILSGTSFLIFAGGNFAQGDPACVIDVDLMVPAGASDGVYANTTSPVTTSIGGNVVVLEPSVSQFEIVSQRVLLTKEFIDEQPVLPGDTTSLLFTISNTDLANTISSINFTDDLGSVISGLEISSLQTASDCQVGGAVIAGLNSPTFSISNLTLAAGASCTVLANMQVPADASTGTYTSTTSIVGGSIGGTPVSGAPASDDFTVVDLDVSFSKAFASALVQAGDTTTLSFTITNNDVDQSASNLAFTDDLSSVIPGLVATGLPVSDVCGSGSLLIGSSTITLTGANLAANGGSCTFDLSLSIPITAAPGTFTNTSSELTSLGALVAAPASADLVISPTPPVFSKSFTPNAVAAGVASTLNFNIDNSGSGTGASLLDFTDNLPSGLMVASPPNASTTCTGGTLTAVPGSSSVSYSGGLVSANSSCVTNVDIVSLLAGVYASTSGELTSSLGNSGIASATLTVSATPPLFSQSFTPNAVAPGQLASLRFAINNNGSLAEASSLGFTNNLPGGLLIASSPNNMNTCGGVLTAGAGSSLVSFSGGLVQAGASCFIQIDVVAPSASGVFVNLSSDLTSSLGSSGSSTSSLTVTDDNDNDSIPNSLDNCPNVANPDQADLDADGLGNVCDADADGDGMPNDWEIANGLNPLSSFDQRADPDRDGFTNLEEYLFGTDPNVADTDNNNNGIPDIVDVRRSIIPPIIKLLLLDDAA